MKTKNFIPTLLALIIRVVVTGQTPGSQFHVLYTLGGGKQPSSPSMGVAKQQALKEKSQAAQKDKSANPSSTTKVYPTLVSEETETSKKTGAIIDNNTFNYYNNPNCYSTRIYASELLKQADELLSIEELLKREAAVLNGDEKDKILVAADKLLKQAEYKQIQASEILGKINLQTFKTNQFIYHDLLIKVTDDDVQSHAENLDAEASYAIKQAKEMREEAYSQPNNSAKLGTMTNAEEKENEALAEQNSAISLLKKSLAANISLYLTDLAIK